MPVACLLFWAALARPAAASGAPEQAVGAWLSLELEGNVYEKLVGGYFLTQLRPIFYPPDDEQIILRGAAYLRVVDECTLWVGAEFDPSFVPELHQEYRIWEQFRVKNELLDSPKLVLWNRTRLEERFIEGARGVALRLRHRVYADVEAEKGVHAVAYEEIFINLNTVQGGPKAGFDENRFFLGLGFDVDEHSRISVGYLDRYIAPDERRTSPSLQHFLEVDLNLWFY